MIRAPGAPRTWAFVLVLALAGCDGSTGRPAPTPTRSPGSSSASPSSASARPAPSPGITLPPSVASRLPSLTAGLGGADPCATASTAFTAASTYLSLAQFGQSGPAQRCVQGGGVAASTTAGLRASSVAQYFVPSGSTAGATIVFRRVDGTSTATVTTSRSGDHFVITAVSTG